MSDSMDPAATEQSLANRPSGPALGQRALAWMLRGASVGALTVTDPLRRTTVHRGSAPGPSAQISIVSWRAIRRLLASGHVGFAEAYMAREVETPDLVALLTWAMRNEAALARVWGGTWAARSAAALQHVLRRNTRVGSQRNIQAHYDLGNDFYAHWLDRGMNYSSALYARPEQSLEEAQSAKLDRIVELLAPAIGCGWGPLAERLASAGCNVTGLTLSPAQLSFARQRLAGVTPTPDLRLADYRSLAETFDRIASIEMIEAVGESYWPTYFRTIARCLKPEGVAVLQAITIDERYYASYRGHPDFIQKHIFPGGMLPTTAIIRDQAAAAGLRQIQVHSFGLSYAQTLSAWRDRFRAALPQLAELGFDDAFRRKWEYYFAYCETGFRLGTLDVGLYQFSRTTG
jgi:cyclopropane-fatty-acyl-phospholipid synthase